MHYLTVFWRYTYDIYKTEINFQNCFNLQVSINEAYIPYGYIKSRQ